ncbi:hypothetical protein DFH06DRAFT_1335634 [Mycena polygramma]|nr:hypothetical protein DFH06DRAFT_1335634 [Mycena polygramma]
MHAVVEVIPLLLHASLLFFFGGLVAFLIPVNIAMTVIVSSVLAIIGAAYSALTLLPLLYLDCPYQTPLSGTFWRLSQSLHRIWHHWRSSATVGSSSNRGSPEILESNLLTDETMVEAMCRTALEYSDERRERDCKALVWTVKSLSNDVELEPFVEAIPDLLWGPTERRRSYDGHLQCLLRNADLDLLDRIRSLLISCDAGILAPEASQRRQITCFKALWALASTTTEWSMPLDFSPIAGSYCSAKNSVTATNYILSTTVLMARSTFFALADQVTELRDRLVAYELDALKSSDGSPELKEVAEALRRIELQLLQFMIPVFNNSD